jgi:hypothetical protein
MSMRTTCLWATGSRMVVAMAEATGEIYRQLAKEARASSVAATTLKSRRQSSDVAAHYEMLADFVEKPTPKG